MHQLLKTLALALLLATLSPRSASAQSYGLGQQILAIGPSEFQPLDSGTTYTNNIADGYVYTHGGQFHAPLRLPDGALITQLCYYAYDPDGSGSHVEIDALKQPAGGQPAGIIPIQGSGVTETFNIGYGAVCTEPSFTYVFHTDADLDGMGVAHVVHEIYQPGSAGGGGTTTAIGGVRITWQRQVSPAPASPTFGDVPPSDPFFQYIEALAASGITGGCGGGNYCPGNPLTRGQMAVFLAKALGLHWVE